MGIHTATLLFLIVFTLLQVLSVQIIRMTDEGLPGKGDVDLSEREYGQEKEEGDLNKEDDQHVQEFRAELDNLIVSTEEGIDSSTQDVNIVGPSIDTASENINTGSSNINTARFKEEEVGAKADLNNLETTMNVNSIPTTRIHKDHLIEQIIRDLHSAPLIRRMS
ncbi:hypothetical protein Tco_0943781 [Tanacetum coccineum]